MPEVHGGESVHAGLCVRQGVSGDEGLQTGGLRPCPGDSQVSHIVFLALYINTHKGKKYINRMPKPTLLHYGNIHDKNDDMIQQTSM